MADHWYITSWAHERTLLGEKITILTDVPCHLWMRWTLLTPWIHKLTRMRRGLAAMQDFYYCFDVYQDNHQLEEGDTLVHTFIKEPWPYCQARWYYFHGNINGKPSPSTSPVLYFHPREPIIPPITPTSDQSILALANVGFCQQWNANSQTFKPDHNYTLRQIAVRVNQYQLTRKGPVTLKLTTSGGNCWSETILFQETRLSETFPVPSSYEWTTYTIPGIPLNLATTYRIVVHTLPPWFYWNGTAWISDESVAAMLWWATGIGGDYPRGQRYTACDCKHNAGYWIPQNDDQNFICYE